MTVVLLDPDLVTGASAAFGSGQQIWITTIEGDPWCSTHAETIHPFASPLDSCVSGWRAPERFRVLDKPCPVWVELEQVAPIPITAPAHWPTTCIDDPRCWQHREVVEFHTTCPECEGDGRVPCKDKHCPDMICRSCRTCGGAGSVLVFKGTCRVVPVVNEDYGADGYVWPDHDCIFVDTSDPNDHHTFLMTAADDMTTGIKLDPLPVPGKDFGLIFEAVS